MLQRAACDPQIHFPPSVTTAKKTDQLLMDFRCLLHCHRGTPYLSSIHHHESSEMLEQVAQ